MSPLFPNTTSKPMLNPILDIRNVLENCDVEWKRGWFWLRIKKGLNCRKGPSPCPEFSLLLSVKFFLSVQHLHLSFLRSLFWKGTMPQQRAGNITGILFIKIPYFSCFAAQKLQKDSIGEHRKYECLQSYTAYRHWVFETAWLFEQR